MTPHRTAPAARHAVRAGAPAGALGGALKGAWPGPRDALDSGSVSELVEDSRGVQLSVASPRPWPVQHHDIAVPSGAPSLLDGLGSYGS